MRFEPIENGCPCITRFAAGIRRTPEVHGRGARVPSVFFNLQVVDGQNFGNTQEDSFCHLLWPTSCIAP